MNASPLDCNICDKELQSPVLLPCLHTVCESCSSTECYCATNSPSSSKNDKLRPDRLSAYLLETSHEETEACANCEEINQPMYFCETCQQSLCNECKTATHQAKMFAKHRILHAEERARVRERVTCELHNEPLILYCGSKKRLVCIHCFNETPLENRQHFVSIDSGYRSCVEKIEKSAAQLKLYQEEKREELEVRERLLNESQQQFETAKNELFQICQQIVDTVLLTRDRLSGKLEEEKKESETQCRSQIAEIQAVMKPVSLCLMASQIMCSSAAKLDVLQLSSELKHRIQAILSRSVDKLPSPKHVHSLESRTELAKALEPFLGLSAAWCPLSAVREKEGSGSTHSYKTRSGSHSLSMPPMLPKFQAMIDLSGAFGQLFARVEGPLKEVTTELSVLSQNVQETQRDLTMRRCLIKVDSIEALTKQCKHVEARLAMHASLLEELQPEMQQIWQEQLDRVRRQQILFREKVDECAALRCTAREVLTAARQLAPFTACIERMTALIDPRRSHPPDPAPMESICLQISTIEPDSQGRIAAIEKEEQNRKAVQEAKKREEQADRGTIVKGLKHGKTSKRKEMTRLLVNTNRERSPGGTDTAVTSPCLRRLSPTVREDVLSESESDGAYAVETFDLWLENALLNTEFSMQDRLEYKSSLSVSIDDNPVGPSTTPLNVDISPNELNRIALAVRKVHDIGDSRQSMLQSLHDIFASQRERDSVSNEESTVLASVVKISQRKRDGDSEGTGEVASENESKPSTSAKKKTTRRRRLKSEVQPATPPEMGPAAMSPEMGPAATSPKMGPAAISSEMGPTAMSPEMGRVAMSPEAGLAAICAAPPEVPFVPREVFDPEGTEKLGGFEAKEKVLKSLKEKVRQRAGSDMSSDSNV